MGARIRNTAAPKGACPECGRIVAIKADGKYRPHRIVPHEKAMCSGGNTKAKG